MSENEKRLEKALLEFVERVVKEPNSEAETNVLPHMAQVLITLWDNR